MISPTYDELHDRVTEDARLLELMAELEKCGKSLADAETMFDDTNPDAVNILLANILRGLSREKYRSLAISLIGDEWYELLRDREIAVKARECCSLSMKLSYAGQRKDVANADYEFWQLVRASMIDPDQPATPDVVADGKERKQMEIPNEP